MRSKTFRKFGAVFVSSMICAAGTWITPSSADLVRAYHTPHIQIGQFNQSCYVRSAPSDSDSLEGVTQVFQFASGKSDRLLLEFDWFGPKIHLHCPNSKQPESQMSLVRMGRQPYGHQASDDEMALEFYYEGRLVARYSTLDIAGSPENVRATISHYKVLSRVLGHSRKNTFSVITVDGRQIDFDIRDGSIL